MSLAELSIKRPTFITCVVILMLAVGYLSMTRLGVDLFPNVTFPVVTVSTPYRGAGPSEVETLVSKPIEEELSSISGIKRLSSINREGFSVVVAEFTLETDVKYAEQQVRDRVGSAKRKLPDDVDESVIRRIDPADQPILIVSIKADLPEDKLYDVASETIKPKIEQVNQVGLVEIIGGRKREIRVALDRKKLKAYEMSATSVAGRLSIAGENVPAGKTDQGKLETIFRTLGEFKSLEDIKNTVVNFYGNDVPTRIKDIGSVTDTLEDEKSRAYVNGEKSLFMMIFRQSGSNTLAVVHAVEDQIKKVNEQLTSLPGKPSISVVRDGSVWIDANVTDVKESIFIGIVLAMVVVYFFLANGRSTIITGLALPNSLIGAFVLMAWAGFTINIMTLLALSLSVGLLIDDAIVVRENIFRHIEHGEDPKKASLAGTKEVTLAVIATTLTVIAVFGPVGFLKGVTGQFFREFGLTICFAMMISLFDALTIAPMLSAYFAGKSGGISTRGIWGGTVGRLVQGFDRFQTKLENKYEATIKFTLRRPILVLGASFVIFLGSCALVSKVPKTFLPPQDAGEFMVSLDLPPGTNLDTMTETAIKTDQILRKNPEVLVSALTIGNRNGEVNVADFFVRLVPAKSRKLNTIQMKDKVREQLKEIAYANPKVKDYDAVGAGQRPFTLNILGSNLKELEDYSAKVFEKVKVHPGLKDVDTSLRVGKPEFQLSLRPDRVEQLGVSTKLIGQELRAQVEGVVPAKLREFGNEYDVRVRMQESDRNLKENYARVFVPNLNGTLIRLSDVANPVETRGAATINRQDRNRNVQIDADITPGAGLGNIMADLTKMFETELPPPAGIRYAFVGQAENFKELADSMAIAMGLGVLFIFLVLSSLYESFVTPLTIMLALPLAIVGSFVALFITGQSLNIFSMIGSIMLLGVATKNSILLVDYANQKMRQGGYERAQAIIEAGKTRLRPILMTTMALIAGTFPVALGLNEASRQRTSMGISIIGGLISSTLLTLVVVPAAYSYIDRFRIWSRTKLSSLFRLRSEGGSNGSGSKSSGSKSSGSKSSGSKSSGSKSSNDASASYSENSPTV